MNPNYYSTINGIFSSLIVIVCVKKGYSWFSVVEHFLFLIVLASGLHTSYPFCFCISTKVLVSLGFFIYETKGSTNLPILRYLIGSIHQPCHALVAAGEQVYHYCQEPGTGNSDQPSGVSDRMFKLEPKSHPRSLNKLLARMFHSPCVGFVIPDFETTNMQQRLEVCGKCHDWAVSAVYVLSCHKFLSYSVVAYARWVSWVGCCMFGAFLFGDVSNDTMKGIFLSDCTLQLITLLDIANLIKFKLEDGKASAHFRRGFENNVLKLTSLCFCIAFLAAHVPVWVHYFGYFFYLLTCAVCGFFVHFWTQHVHHPLAGSEHSNTDDWKPKKPTKKPTRRQRK